MATAPKVFYIQATNIAAQYIALEWEDVGVVFNYRLERSVNGGDFFFVDNIANNTYFDRNLTPLTTYKYRVSAQSIDFDPSDFTESEEIKTFEFNSWTIMAQNEVNLFDSFFDEKLKEGNDTTNFNTSNIKVALMDNLYVFDNRQDKITDHDVGGFIVKNFEQQLILNPPPDTCVKDDNGNSDISKIYPVRFKDDILIFEQKQKRIIYTEDKTLNWKLNRRLLPLKIGSPTSTKIAAIDGNLFFLIAHEGILASNDSFNIRWSSDQIKFSNDFVNFGRNTISDGKYNFDKILNLPPGVNPGQIDSIEINKNILHVTAGNKSYTHKIFAPRFDTNPNSPTYLDKLWDVQTYNITSKSNAFVRNLISFKDNLYAFVPGLRDGENFIGDDEAGVYKFFEDSGEWIRVYGLNEDEREIIHPERSLMSRSDNELIIGLENKHFSILVETVGEPTLEYDATYDLNDTVVTTRERDFRTSLRSLNGTSYISDSENYHFEENYNYYDGKRIWINFQGNVMIIDSESSFIEDLENSSEVLTDNGIFTFYGDNKTFNFFPGFAGGAIIFNGDTGDLIAFYNFPLRLSTNASVVWNPANVVFSAILSTTVDQAVDVLEEFSKEPRDIIPDLSAFVPKIIPEHMIQNNPLFAKFVEYYMQYISDTRASDYGLLFDLVKNKDVNETRFIELFSNDLINRNRSLSDSEKVKIIKWFNNKKKEIFTIKGIEDSYKFLFKYLYDVDVSVQVHDNTQFDVSIVVDSVTITDDIVGNKLVYNNGEAIGTVVYYDRVYIDGNAYWEVTMVDVVGIFPVGETVELNTNSQITGNIIEGAKGKIRLTDGDEILNKGNTYYNVSIKTVLPLSKYKDDVLTFVHPVGFGLTGILLITMIVKAGISPRHKETIVDFFRNYRWSFGLPSHYPNEIPDLDAEGNYQIVDRKILMKPHPNAGQEFDIATWNAAYPSDNRDYLADNPGLNSFGQDADERRKTGSPTFDASGTRFVNMMRIVEKRLKSFPNYANSSPYDGSQRYDEKS